MNYRSLGESALQVSPICLGTMMFGDRTDLSEAARIVDHAREAGINFIDTADVYAKGESERITGSLIRAHRSHWILATKVGNAMGEGPDERGVGRAWMTRALDASLERLGTDCIDIYYLHRDPGDTPLAETLGALGDFMRQGKIRHYALSNFRAWRIAEAVRLSACMGLPKPICVQPYYNAMNRMPEVELLPACHFHGLGVVPYSPLARGVLTGKYAPDAAPPEGSRAHRSDKRFLQTEFRKESMEHARRIQAFAEKRGVTSGQFATAWVLASEIVSSVLAGPRTLEQWTEYLGALDVQWDQESEELVDSLVAPGHPSTPGYSDPMYPFFGRTRKGNPVK